MGFVIRNAKVFRILFACIAFVLLMLGHDGGTCTGSDTKVFLTGVFASAPFVLLFFVIGIMEMINPANGRRSVMISEGIIAAILVFLLGFSLDVIRVTLLYGSNACDVQGFDGPINYGPYFSGPYDADTVLIGIGFGLAPLIMLIMSLSLLLMSVRASHRAMPRT
ncbi:hypothetical protein [Oryzifoliimicrobium ureilyticus]|uniref:hypothetical protein n=1 Tax=Oryzifoliimicrobium ureilyticus TaxID=3113724 RepID=UPI003075F9BB